MNLPLEVRNITNRIANAYAAAGKELLIDGSSGAAAQREREGWFNVFYKLLSNGAAENYFVRDPADIAVFVRVLADVATEVTHDPIASFAEARFCFRDCFVYRTNCFDANNAAKPWYCALCVDFDTPPKQDKTRKPDRELTPESVAELVDALAEFVEGCDLREEPFIAYGSNKFADKSVSLHIVFYECVLSRSAAGKMTKQLSERIGELPICRSLYVQPDFSIYSSGLKPLGMDKQVDRTWRGDAQWLISMKTELGEESTEDENWRNIFEKTCIVVLPQDAMTRKVVSWKSDNPAPPRRIRRDITTAEGSALATTIIASNVVDFEERIKGTFSAFANCAFRVGSKPNILVPIACSWCPYKQDAHDKVQVGFFCDERTKVVSVHCFSSECKLHPSYPFKILPPARGGEELEDEALRIFSDFCILVIGHPVGKTVVCRLPNDYSTTFVVMSPGDFKTANRDKHTILYGSRGKATKIFYTDVWLESSRVLRAFAGYVMRPTDSRMVIPVGDLFAINLWRGFPPQVEIDSETDAETAELRCPLILQHINQNVCGGDPQLQEFVFNWLAFMVQKLNKKPGVALWLKGKGGQGKNELYNYLVAMLGPWHTYKTSDPSALSGAFNSHVARTRLLLVEEQKGSNDAKIQSAFNDFITCDKWEVKEKYVPNREDDNFTCLMGFANEAFSGQRQKVGERRYQTMEVLYRLPRDKFEFFPALQHERDHGGAGALLAVLRRRDIEGWFPESRIVQTEAGWMDQLHSLPKLRQWWFHVLRQGRLFDGEYNDPTTGELVDGDVFGKVVLKYLFLQSAHKWQQDATDAQVWVAIKQGFPRGTRHIANQPWHEPRQQRGVMVTVPALAECKRVFETCHGYPEFIWTAKETFE